MMNQTSTSPASSPVPNPTISYWHDPPSPLATHRTTDMLPSNADTVIVGSGISGAMVAWNLLEAGRTNILMLEARSAVGGATGRNGGHTKAASYRSFLHNLSSLGSPDEALKIAKLEHANIRATHAFAAMHNFDCESRPCNTVDIIYDPDSFAKGKQAIQHLQDSFEKDGGKTALEEGGPGWYRIFDGDEAAKRFFVAKENTNDWLIQNGSEKEKMQGAFEYEAGSISAYRFTSSVLELCLKRGLNLQTHTTVTSLSKLAADDDGNRWEVRTQRGTVKAKIVVLATNGYTAHLLPSLQHSIIPLRGQIQAQRPGPHTSFTTPLPTTYSFVYRSGFEYLIPRALSNGAISAREKQHIVIGGGIGRLPSGGKSEFGRYDDDRINPDITAYLSGTGKGYYGENWGGTGAERDVQVREWTGIMGTTPDERPFVGQIPAALTAGSAESPETNTGLYLLAGFNGHGMVLCLKCAEALVSIIQERRVPSWFPTSFLLTEKRTYG